MQMHPNAIIWFCLSDMLEKNPHATNLLKVM